MTRRGDDSTPDERSIELTLDLFNEHDTDALAKIVEAEDTLPKGYFSELSWAVSSNERASAAGSLEEQRRLRREALQPYIEWNRDAFSNGWLMSWAIRLSGVLIGNVQLWPTENPSEFEMGFWITSTHKRKGYMSRVANWIADVAFSHLEANRVIITTTDTNTQVLEFARALGFSDEGIDDDHLQCGLRPKQITSVRKFSKSNPLRGVGVLGIRAPKSLRGD
jgi:RimJ/RimL family protein N-acetyltransferase